MPPREKGSPGHFVWKEHKNGYIDLVEKVSIKILVTYYGIMPGKKIPYMQQHKALFADGTPQLALLAVFVVFWKKIMKNLMSGQTLGLCFWLPEQPQRLVNA